MADPLISVVIEQLFSIVGQAVSDEINLVRGVGMEVENLTSLMKGIQGVLNDADNRRVEESVKVWLVQFEELFYDMDNVLDEWHTTILQKQIKKVHFPFSSPLSYFKRLRTHREIALEIKKLNKRLEFIDNSRRKLDLLPGSGTDIKQFKPLQSISLIDKSGILGRHSDQESLVSKLLLDGIPHGKSFDVISIVGTGGLGKTTLAQLAFNDDRVKKQFDHKIWVCVSDPFNESQVAQTILESINGSAQNLPSLDTVLIKIKQILSTKRALLVLDDVWPHDGNKWDQLRLCLQDVAPQSKVLVTTRDRRVAVSMGTNHFQRLDTLSEEECWSLVSKIAFDNKNIDEGDKEKFEITGRKLAIKCQGLPLAAKTIGGVLLLKDSVDEWNNILVSKLWELENVKLQLFPHLFLSYSHLPLGLRRCFKVCSIFPKDCTIKTKNLIKIWMSLGYLFTDKNNDDMEGKGYEYVEILVMCSFFQNVERRNVDKKIRSFKIHDIVHDFAQYLMENECLVDPGNNDISSKRWRHVTIVNSFDSTRISYMSSMENVRTLFFYGLDTINLEGLSNLLQHMKYMRGLNLSRCHLLEVPNEITSLIHLRYLDLSYNLMGELPKGICDLCNLETLILNRCSELRKLPKSIGKLIILRHLMLKHTKNLQQLPEGILKLTRLRTLTKVIVGKGNLKLGDLKHFNYLEGEVSIEIYDTEEEDVDATDVFYITEKIRILSFHCMRLNETDVDVLRRFEFSQNLIRLSSFKFPSSNAAFVPLISTFRNVRNLHIRHCHDETLPPFWQLQFLEVLQIEWNIRLLRVGVEFVGMGAGTNENYPIIAFPKLKKLEFCACVSLMKWEDLPDRETDEDLVMPSLVELKIVVCPKLEDLPHGLLNRLPQLKDIDIGGSHELERRYKEGEWAKQLWISRVTLDS